jgi:hypothetical protein
MLNIILIILSLFLAGQLGFSLGVWYWNRQIDKTVLQWLKTENLEDHPSLKRIYERLSKKIN